jgi:hypothetical protein
MANPNVPHARNGGHHHHRGDRNRFDSRGISHGAQPSARRPESGHAARQPMQFRRGPDATPAHDQNDGGRRNRGTAQAQQFQSNAFRSVPSAQRNDRDIGAPPPRQAYRGDGRGAPHQDHGSYGGHGKHGYNHHGYSKYRYGGPPPRVVVIGRPYPPGAWYYVPPHRRYYYRNVWIVRPYGHWYRGYGHYYTYDDAYPWLAFTAVTLGILTLLTVAQQRAYEQAQIDATTAPVGSSIQWNEGDAYGAVSVLRDGQSTSGRYCREFQQMVTIGGRSEQAYGTACMQPDGAWQIVDTR